VQTVTEVKIPLGVGGEVEYAPTVTGTVFLTVEATGRLVTIGAVVSVPAPQLVKTNNMMACVATRR
jgi:hypothetical protein